jgi:acetyl esterase/lipase
VHEEEAREVLPAVLGGLDVDRPILVGHSDGGSIALIYAAAARVEVRCWSGGQVNGKGKARDGLPARRAFGRCEMLEAR